MILDHGLHLAYCTNVHPGRDWAETFQSLNRWALAVKQRVCREGPFAIGLRLSDRAARELGDSAALIQFQRWLEKHGCYVFTINGFPFGQFHGTRVKEKVYLPDWTSPERVDYTNRLFDLLARLVPEGLEGSVSTLPGSFKDFITTPEQEELIRGNLWRSIEHIARVSESSGRRLHLGLEPEPFCWIENSLETAELFDRLREDHPNDSRLGLYLGVNYDTCHFAIEFEEPGEVLARFQEHGIRLSKLHISNALTVHPTVPALDRLKAFAEDVYLHQTISRDSNGQLARFKDLDVALERASKESLPEQCEWRVHFHIPLHAQPPDGFGATSDHIEGVLEWLSADPKRCTHLEMETYTWAVLPKPFKTTDVSEQLAREYEWTLKRLCERGLANNEQLPVLS